MASKRIMAAGMMVLLAVGGAIAQTSTAPSSKATPTQLLVRQVSGVSMAKVPLARVLKDYGGLSGLDIEADWDALKPAGVTQDTPVTLKAKGITFDKLLDLTLNSIARDEQPLSWYLTGSTVTVTTQARVLLRGRIAAPLAERPAKGREAAGPLPREFNFEQTPLKLVLEFLATVAQVNVHVHWKSLEAAGISPETPVSIKSRGISVARALDLTLDQLNAGRDRLSSAYWVIQDGVVEIATGEALDKTTTVRIFDVGDLLMVVPNFKAPQIDITSAGNNGTGGNNTSGGGGLFGNQSGGNNASTGGDEEGTAEVRKRQRDTLIEIIKSSIGEDMWAPTGKGTVQILHGKLIISQTPLGFKLLEKASNR